MQLSTCCTRGSQGPEAPGPLSPAARNSDGLWFFDVSSACENGPASTWAAEGADDVDVRPGVQLSSAPKRLGRPSMSPW